MKRSDLLRQLNQAGCQLHRHGARHVIYINPATGQKQPVPRHSEIDEMYTPEGGEADLARR